MTSFESRHSLLLISKELLIPWHSQGKTNSQRADPIPTKHAWTGPAFVIVVLLYILLNISLIRMIAHDVQYLISIWFLSLFVGSNFHSSPLRKKAQPTLSMVF